MLLKKFLIAAGILLLLIIIFNKPIRGFILKKVVDNIYKDSIVATISPEELSSSKNYLLLDTRSREEFEVSHIENATWIGYKEFDENTLRDFPKDTPVVVYCSIGYRSQHIGEQLLQSGRFNDVRNLYGGIFYWKNKDYSVFNEVGETDSIHTYSRKWSYLVLKGKKVY